MSWVIYISRARCVYTALVAVCILLVQRRIWDHFHMAPAFGMPDWLTIKERYADVLCALDSLKGVFSNRKNTATYSTPDALLHGIG